MDTATQKTPAGYKQTDVGVISKDWDVVTLGGFNTEKFPIINPQQYQEETFEYFSIPNYQEYRKPTMVLGKDILSSKILLKNNAVLFGRLNPRVEKVWLIKSSSSKRKIGSGEWITIFPDITKNSPKYIFYLVWSKFVMPIAKENVSGSTPSRQRVISSYFYKINVPVPTNPKEQTVIAKVLSDTDELIEKLEKLIAKKRSIKQGTMQELLIGKGRLPGFSKKWNTKTLGDLLSYVQPTNYLVQNEKYSDLYMTPVLTPGKSFILGYTNETSGIFEEMPIILFDDFTTACKYVDFPFKVKSSAVKMLKLKDRKNSLRFVFETMQGVSFVVSDHKRYWISEYQNIEIRIPEYKEQYAIAEVLSEMDKEINFLEQNHAKYRQIKTGMMQQLLTGKIRIYGKN